MTLRTATAALLAALALGCGGYGDPTPENIEVREYFRPGEADDGRVRTRHAYDEFEEWASEVGPLPPGISYRTTDVCRQCDEVLVIGYEIAVEPWVEPAVYEFRVKYDLVEWGDPWRETIRLYFRLTVLDPDPHGGIFLARVAQALAPGQEEGGLSLVLR